MNDICTYLIQLRGQVDEDEINTINPLPMTMERAGTTATLFTTFTGRDSYSRP